jgi:hypothetical protein
MLTRHDMSHTGKGCHIGYWKTSRANDPSDLPWPGDYIDETWDPAEREAVATYLDAQPDVQAWKGYSFCRLGCEHHSSIGTTDKSDGIFVWPAGFSHYIRKHSVRPPQEFIDHVLSRKRITKASVPKRGLPGVYPLPDWVQVGVRARVAVDHGQELMPVGTVVIVHSFVGDDVNLELEGKLTLDGEPVYFHYMRGDFAGLFEQVPLPTGPRFFEPSWVTTPAKL